MKKLKKITLKVGKKVFIATPNGNKLKPHTIWIEKIFKSSNKTKKETMIIYRVWSFKWKRWRFYIDSFDTLDLWNEHMFQLKVYKNEKNKKKRKKSIPTTSKNKISKTLE